MCLRGQRLPDHPDPALSKLARLLVFAESRVVRRGGCLTLKTLHTRKKWRGAYQIVVSHLHLCTGALGWSGEVLFQARNEHMELIPEGDRDHEIGDSIRDDIISWRGSK